MTNDASESQSGPLLESWGALLRRSKGGRILIADLRPCSGRINDEVAAKHLPPLERLRELYLADSLITDSSLPVLTGLLRLETLDVSRTRVTEAVLEAARRLPRLKVLMVTGGDISTTAITAARPKMIGVRIIA